MSQAGICLKSLMAIGRVTVLKTQTLVYDVNKPFNAPEMVLTSDQMTDGWGQIDGNRFQEMGMRRKRFR